jgi:hypothetical protein
MASVRVNVSAPQVAGFQVTLSGRFCLTPEGEDVVLR